MLPMLRCVICNLKVPVPTPGIYCNYVCAKLLFRIDVKQKNNRIGCWLRWCGRRSLAHEALESPAHPLDGDEEVDGAVDGDVEVADVDV